MSGELQTRKRKDKRKKRGDDGSRQDDVLDKSSLNDRAEDELFNKDDSDEKNNDDNHDSHHHESHGGVFAKVLFAILFLGLLASLGTIFFQLKGTDLVDTPIKESRYVSILESFVDEHVDDHHDDHGGHEEDHDHDDDEDHDHDELSEGEDDEHKSEDEEAVTHDEHEEGGREKTEEHTASEKVERSLPESVLQPDVTEDENAEESLDAENVEGEEETADEVSSPKADLVEDLSRLESENPSKIEHEDEDDGDDDDEDDEDDEQSQGDDISDNVEGFEGFFQEPFIPAEDEAQSEQPEDEPPSEQPDDDESAEQIQFSREESVHVEEANVPEIETAYRGYYGDFEEEGDDDDEDDDDDDDEDDGDEQSESLHNTQKEKSNKESRASYPASSITNDYDYLIRDELDDAHRILEKAPEKAQKSFTSILEQYPKSPRAMYGKAMSLDRLSEMLGSNSILEQSIYLYRDVLDLPDVPSDLYKIAGFRCVDRMRFRGFHSKAVRVLQRMQQKLPNMVEILNQMAVTYLIMGQNKNAKEILERALKMQPTSGFAKAHYGFVLKTEDRVYGKAAQYMKEGIESGEPGTLDGRFYFHLGDALTRDGRPDEALKVYEDGVRLGLFLSVYQRSLYNEPSLTARPWWNPEQTTYQGYLKLLERNWELIKSEALPLLDDEDQGFFPENEGLRKDGIWKQFEMFAKGEKITQNCERTPKTCRLIESIPDAATCRRGQVKLSLLLPGTYVWPHTGPTNCRLRAHLGLVTPKGPKIRVANETRTWKEGEFLIFDDSFEHEVWNDGDSYRLVLIVDFWHPELTATQKRTLPAI